MQDYAFPLSSNAWSGSSPAAAAGQLRWEYGKSTALTIRDILHDWSGYNSLVFTLRSSKASDSRLYIIIPSEDKDKEGMDYFATTLKLDFEGERAFELPFDELGRTRNPVGWHKIDSFTLHSKWNPNDAPDPAVVLTFTDVRLRAGQKAKGPRMTDEQLFAALDLDRPGLAKVKAAVARNDLSTAKHELAEHLRSRPAPRWFVDPRTRPTLGQPPVAIRAEKGKGGRYAARVSLGKPGWNRVVLPKTAFEKQGNPLGWDAISGLRLQVVGQAAEPSLVICLDDIKLAGTTASHSLSDFEREPSGWSGLVLAEEQGRRCGKWWFMNITPSVSCQAAPRDWARFDALEFWLHVAQPSKAQVAVTADSYPPDTTYADMILTRKFHIGSFRENVVDFGSRINWNSNPTEGEAKTVEWNAVLNRHFHFTALYRAYWATGDEKYAKELADQIVGWVEDCPMLLFQSGNSPYHYAWGTLNTAVRLQNTWPETFAHCLLSPSFTDHALVTMVKSMAEQARHLVKWPTSGNWLTAESLGIYVVGTLLPEFKEAPGWRKLALERLYKQLDDEVYPDGLEYEVALGYNLWVLSEYIQILEIAKLNDALGEIPADYRGRIEKMFNYLMYDSMPDGVAVGLNDSGNAPVRAKLIEGYRYFPHRHDFPYVASNGLQGQPPERTSYAFPYTGHYVMRSGWDKDARFLHLDGGLFGYGHQHEDKLHFVVAAYGKQLLLDAGNYTYDASRWRRYVLSTRGHNTILVDGQDQNRRRQRDTHVWPKPWTAPAPPTDTRFVTTSGFDYAIGFYKDGYGPQVDKSVTHTRQIYFAKPDYWLVLDTLTATDGKPHTCDSLFHIAAAEAAVDPKTKAVTTSEKDAPNLALVPLDDASLKVAVVKGKTEEPVQGWSHVNGPWRAVPTAIFSKEWTERTQLLYVVHPSPPGATATPAVTRLDAKGDGLAVCVERPGRAKDFFLVQSKPGTLMEAGDVVSDAEVAACSQRRSASEVASPPGTGVPDYERGSDFRLCMAQGTKLKAGACGLTLSKPASISVESLADGLYLLNFAGEAADTCELQLAEKATPQVFRLDKNLDRKGVVATSLRFPVEPHGLYEINFGSKKSVKEVKAEQAASAAKPKVAVDFPLRPQAPLPPTKGVKVVVQAEDFSAQGGGAVTVTDKKVNAQGKAFLNWDKPGHWLEWKFRVPQDGEYRIAVKCCSESPAPQRAVVVDGAFPSEACQRLDFPSTGGWSNERDDWKLVTLSDPKAQKPLAFHLRAGEHTLRMVNLQDSMNLDFLVIFSPDQPP